MSFRSIQSKIGVSPTKAQDPKKINGIVISQLEEDARQFNETVAIQDEVLTPEKFIDYIQQSTFLNDFTYELYLANPKWTQEDVQAWFSNQQLEKSHILFQYFYDYLSKSTLDKEDVSYTETGIVIGEREFRVTNCHYALTDYITDLDELTSEEKVSLNKVTKNLEHPEAIAKIIDDPALSKAILLKLQQMNIHLPAITNLSVNEIPGGIHLAINQGQQKPVIMMLPYKPDINKAVQEITVLIEENRHLYKGKNKKLLSDFLQDLHEKFEPYQIFQDLEKGIAKLGDSIKEFSADTSSVVRQKSYNRVSSDTKRIKEIDLFVAEYQKQLDLLQERLKVYKDLDETAATITIPNLKMLYTENKATNPMYAWHKFKVQAEVFNQKLAESGLLPQLKEKLYNEDQPHKIAQLQNKVFSLFKALEAPARTAPNHALPLKIKEYFANHFLLKLPAPSLYFEQNAKQPSLLKLENLPATTTVFRQKLATYLQLNPTKAAAPMAKPAPKI